MDIGRIILFIALGWTLSACQLTPQIAQQKMCRTSQTLPSMGTVFELQVVHVCREPVRKELFVHVQNQLNEWESELSLYQPTSAISKLNSSGAVGPISPFFAHLVRLSIDSYDHTEGAFNIAIRPVQELMARTKMSMDSVRLSAFRSRIDVKKIVLKEKSDGIHVLFLEKNMQITLDGVAKGFAVDKISSLLMELGHENYLINFSGNMRWKGVREDGKMWSIAIWHPQDKSISSVKLPQAGAVATSGNEHRFYSNDKKIHHLINPNTLRSAHYFKSLTVVGPEAAICDMLSTALFVMDPDKHGEIIDKHYPEYLVYSQPAN